MKKSLFYLFFVALALSACGGGSGDDSAMGTYNEETGEYMTERNEFAEIDSYKPKSMAEREEIAKHWNTSRKEVRWQEYKGTMVRVEILLGDSDIREMRLRIMQNANGADVDADMRTILGKVADYEMKRVCGRSVESIVMVYDRPSSEIMRPTSFFDYRVEAEGASMREYGFRCIYSDF